MSNVKTSTAPAVCVSVALLMGASGCTRSGAVTPGPAEKQGVIAGIVDLCTGPAARPPTTATVRVIRGGVTVTSASVVAGDPVHQRYSVHVRPGRYTVEASNWPQVRRAVTVEAGSSVTADFPNFCD